MIRLAARALISLLANAVGLVVAAQLLDDMSLSVAGFVTASLIFTVVAVVSEPLIRQIALKNVPAILGSSALIATLASLILTSVLTDGLRISGLTTWVLATVVVWAAALAANLLLPLVIFKRVLAEARDGA
ncbi:MAG TPA: phage holin family protein [Acidimicrobiales bacterium]|nr:phage holin family protein [Acidimicrobiales bacterium]HRA34391.1 phage holin family protein [Acidimicrobiales bacterium]